MALSNIHFDLDPINYLPNRITQRGTTTVIPQMSDNSYETSSAETDIDINMEDASGNATAIDKVFLKYTGTLTSYTFTPTGGTGSAFTRTVPTEVDTYEGTTTDLTVDGFEHDLYEIPTTITATSVRMQFTGSNLRIYALMLLESGLELTANGNGRMFSRIDPVRVDRTGRVITNPQTGELRRVSQIGATREKWEVDLQIEFKRGSALTAKDFLYWKAKNPHLVFVNEFSRNPDEVYPAAFADLEVQVPLRTRWKAQGHRTAFRIAER